MSNDIKNDGLIIQEINLGSKMYLYKYINKSNQICTTMKTKGLPTKYLSEQFFNDSNTFLTLLLIVIVPDSSLKNFSLKYLVGNPFVFIVVHI